jgi:calcium channel MID1
MKLSPLQSRLAASLAASVLLLSFYFLFFSPHFATAQELKQALPIILDDIDPDASLLSPESQSTLNPDYEPDFAPFDRGIIGRAPPGVTALLNNGPYSINVVAGSTQVFVFEATTIFGRAIGVSEELELRQEHGGRPRANEPQGGVNASTGDVRKDEATEVADHAKRETNKVVYISANTCQQPGMKPNQTTMDPPQLTMFVSTSSKNQSPGPNARSDEQVVVEFVEGAAMYNLSASDDVYLGIHAPNVSSVFSGQTYNVEVAASVDGFFHSFNAEEDADLIWVDSDSQGALLITHNLTDSTDEKVVDAIMQTQPFVMFAQNKNDSSIDGLKFSYCGLQNHAQIAATNNGQFTSMVTTGMTRRGPGNLPKQQFYFSGLNSSTQYIGILALNGQDGKTGNGVVGGGGHVYRATNFSTKSGKLPSPAAIHGRSANTWTRPWELPDHSQPPLLRPSSVLCPGQHEKLWQCEPPRPVLRQLRSNHVCQL